MYQCKCDMICDTVQELLGIVGKPKIASKGSHSRSKYQQRYIDITCTFDIETTNTDTDGFAYSWQTCVGGAVIVPRYYEDWCNVLETLVDRWHISSKRRLVVYVHNLGYEHQYIAQLLASRWGLADSLYTKSRKPLYLRYDNGIEFRDSLKLFQKSLARATEGCTHAKLVGDLDYTVYRTPDTILTEQELAYCVNDVLGLWEAIERLKSERGYNQATIPYTNTAIVIEAVRKEIHGDTKCSAAMSALKLDKHQTALAYNCMAGGDTHGTRWRAGKTYHNCNSYDFKSAHPSQQLLWKFPAGKPETIPEELDERALKGLICGGYGWIAKLVIINPCIQPDCPDPCISLSKCPDVVGLGELDNGRVLDAKALYVYADSNDYQRIMDGYTYDSITAVDTVIFKLDYLPESFRKAIYEKFRVKESEKGSPDYAFAKVCVNTIFGACAQKTIRDEYLCNILDDGMENVHHGWQENLESKTEDDVKKAQERKFPFLWGLWTASLSRLKLWNLLKIVGWEKVIYWDTDSCKYVGEKIPAVEAYNDTVRAQCVARNCVVTRKDGSMVCIGVAEDEHPADRYGMTEFRFLHAKCYACRDADGTVESTIAGVGKKQGVQALGGSIDNLRDGLYIVDAGGQCLTYHDAPIHARTDFARPTVSASWVVMTPREYRVSDPRSLLYDAEIMG